MPELLYLIDVYSLVFQVFHAIPEMTSPHGLPTNAVFGFTRDILNILRQKKPTHLVCATDPSGPGERETSILSTKRTAAPPRKSSGRSSRSSPRRSPPSEFPSSKSPAGKPTTSSPRSLPPPRQRDMDVCIVTNDKDARQLLGPRVKIYHVRKNQYLDEAELLADWGVRPDQVIDFQSLVGDSVDNVPGVPLVGPKKASALLAQFQTLEGVLAHADEAPGAKLARKPEDIRRPGAAQPRAGPPAPRPAGRHRLGSRAGRALGRRAAAAIVPRIRVPPVWRRSARAGRRSCRQSPDPATSQYH